MQNYGQDWYEQFYAMAQSETGNVKMRLHLLPPGREVMLRCTNSHMHHLAAGRVMIQKRAQARERIGR